MDIVDENNFVIGTCSRDEIYSQGYNHRIAHILLFDNFGRLALQKRADSVSFCPGYWVTSAGGHVKSGETYSEAASRELKEEIGVDSDLDFVLTGEYHLGKSIKFLSVFTSSSDIIKKIDPKYVTKVIFLSLVDIKSMIGNKEKFHPELLFVFDVIFDAQMWRNL